MKRSADLEEEQVTMSMGVAQEQIIEGFRIARVIRKHRAEASVAVMACISACRPSCAGWKGIANNDTFQRLLDLL